MRTDFLVLPFYDDIRKTSLFSKALYNTAPNVAFRIYTERDGLLPFLLPFVKENFTIQIRDYYGDICAEIPRAKIKHKVVKFADKRFIKFDGGKVDCLELLSCDVPYTITCEGYFSEWFWAANTDNMVKFQIGGTKDFSLIPYSLGFKQYFWLDTNFGTSELDIFKNTSRDEVGEVSTRYQRVTEVFNFYFFNVPAHIKQVFSSFEVLDSIVLSDSEQTITCKEKQAQVKQKRSETNFSLYEIELNIPSTNENEVSYCTEQIFELDTEFTGVEVVTDGGCVEFNPSQGYEIDCFDEYEGLVVTVLINY